MLKTSAVALEIRERLKSEILILDGAMGTMIQQYKLKEERVALSAKMPK